MPNPILLFHNSWQCVTTPCCWNIGLPQCPMASFPSKFFCPWMASYPTSFSSPFLDYLQFGLYFQYSPLWWVVNLVALPPFMHTPFSPEWSLVRTQRFGHTSPLFQVHRIGASLKVLAHPSRSDCGEWTSCSIWLWTCSKANFPLSLARHLFVLSTTIGCCLLKETTPT
jgi:hypothetical protein